MTGVYCEACGATPAHASPEHRPLYDHLCARCAACHACRSRRARLDVTEYDDAGCEHCRREYDEMIARYDAAVAEGEPHE